MRESATAEIMKARLSGSSDFQKVYREGKRYEGFLMTAFVLPNCSSHHRLGITASRKAVGKAVQRNRAKRLLKEAFRLEAHSLQTLRLSYDWVLNARSRTASAKIVGVLADFEELLARVASDEAAVDSQVK